MKQKNQWFLSLILRDKWPTNQRRKRDLDGINIINIINIIKFF